jgi:hypothetical protein
MREDLARMAKVALGGRLSEHLRDLESAGFLSVDIRSGCSRAASSAAQPLVVHPLITLAYLLLLAATVVRVFALVGSLPGDLQVG